MKFTTSINIEHQQNDNFNYIPTQNAKNIIGNIVNSFHSGIHSFNIIGSYGTGKSSFIVALEKNLLSNETILIHNNGQFNGFKKFEFMNVVGDYASLIKIINEKLDNFNYSDSKNFFKVFDSYYNSLVADKKFLFVMIDEFGKILEYAAKNNPEKELYFIQQFTEYVNDPTKNIILLTTLHQNFSSYARKLSYEQKNEWIKVKGRFKELVFNEPVEQLLFLAASRLDKQKSIDSVGFVKLYNAAIETKFSSSSITYETASKLFPLDLFAANVLTLAIQRYGQNERTLFTFLEAKGDNSISEFKTIENNTYNLADVYDYIIYNFYSYLSEANSDSMNWSAMRVAIERVEGLFPEELIPDTCKLVKAIGLFNLFGSGKSSITKDVLNTYSEFALGIENVNAIIELLLHFKIIRYAIYKGQYILFEGTDVNIEDEITKAGSAVRRSTDIIEKLQSLFNFRITPAIATYYKKGTPRYFEYSIMPTPIPLIPVGETDGYISLIFNDDVSGLAKTIEVSKNCTEAILYVYFKNVEAIIDHIFQIDKLEYILKTILVDNTDRVAIKEIEKLIEHEKGLLNKAVLESMFNYTNDVEWVYKGELISIKNRAEFNKFLSYICDDIYTETPIFNNELVNKHKPSGTISLARINYLQALLENSDQRFLGFPDDKFPPEKTIYMTLLNNTGMHKHVTGITYELGAPSEESFASLWNLCENFLQSSAEKPKRLNELIKELKSKPYKLKQGFIDVWLPTYLVVKKDDFSLYNSNGTYIPNINREVLDILQKAPSDFSVKAFSVDGVKLDLFNKYREYLNLEDEEFISSDKFIETIKPFLTFYKKLNGYAKQTKKFDSNNTLRFRDILAKAKDPEKTFFEDLPKAMGYKDRELADNKDFLKRYVETIQNSIRDLRTCYDGLIDRIEESLIDKLRLKSNNYDDYKVELELRYKNIKTHLLTTKQKNFLNRVISPLKDRKSWIQSISYIILDKQLENLIDDEEEVLIDNLIYLFNELSKYVEISKSTIGTDDDFFKLELISKSGVLKPRVYRIPESKTKDVKLLESKINNLLSGDNEIDICTLLNILNNKLNNE